MVGTITLWYGYYGVLVAFLCFLGHRSAQFIQILISDFPVLVRESHVENTFKPFIKGLNEVEILEYLRLTKESEKPIKYFSSGMKQRLKIGLAILADAPLLLLDEPISNLDKEGVNWFNNLMNEFIKHKTVIIASNNTEQEIEFCETIIDISNFKKR